eukprot:3466016-Rhodomonas_salina.1
MAELMGRRPLFPGAPPTQFRFPPLAVLFVPGMQLISHMQPTTRHRFPTSSFISRARGHALMSGSPYQGHRLEDTGLRVWGVQSGLYNE